MLKKQITITRPTNTTAYVSGEVINTNGSLLSIPLDLSGGGVKQILGGQIFSTNPSGTTDLILHLFSEQFAIAADNAIFSPTIEQLKTKVGQIRFSVIDWNLYTTCKDCPGRPLAIQTINGGIVYCVLTAANTYTPTSGEQITIQIDVNN